MMQRRRIRSSSPPLLVVVDESDKTVDTTTTVNTSPKSKSLSPSMPWHLLQIQRSGASSVCTTPSSRCTNNNLLSATNVSSTMPTPLSSHLQSRAVSSSSSTNNNCFSRVCTDLRFSHQQQQQIVKAKKNDDDVLELSSSSLAQALAADGFAISPLQQELNHDEDDDADSSDKKCSNSSSSNNIKDTTSGTSPLPVSPVFPVDQLPHRFSDPTFLSEGGYGKVVAAVDNVAATSSSSGNVRCAVKVMDFVCDAEDGQRVCSLAQYGDLTQLLAGQEYVPAHIAAELHAHTALRDVVGAMPLQRVEIFVEEEKSADAEDNNTANSSRSFVRVWVMLVLPLLTPLHSSFFVKNNNQHQHLLLPTVTQLAVALQDMHSRNWLHRDLSVGNTFLLLRNSNDNSDSSSSSSSAIIGDFGLAACVRGRCSAAMEFTASAANACTTVWYRSPEILADPALPYSFEHDLWSLGCVVAELALGRPVFPGMTREEQNIRIADAFDKAPTAAEMAESLLGDHMDDQRKKIVHAASRHLLQRDGTRRSLVRFLEALKQ